MDGNFCERAPLSGRTIGRQSARSRAEFIAKLGIAEEECDESIYWIELLVALQCVTNSRVAELCNEAEELVSMIVASIKTARRNRH